MTPDKPVTLADGNMYLTDNSGPTGISKVFGEEYWRQLIAHDENVIRSIYPGAVITDKCIYIAETENTQKACWWQNIQRASPAKE